VVGGGEDDSSAYHTPRTIDLVQLLEDRAGEDSFLLGTVNGPADGRETIG